MNKFSKRKNIKGFTLVELIIVIAIISIIALIAIPSFGNFIEDSKVKSIEANQNSVIKVLSIVAIENELPYDLSPENQRDKIKKIIDDNIKIKNPINKSDKVYVSNKISDKVSVVIAYSNRKPITSQTTKSYLYIPSGDNKARVDGAIIIQLRTDGYIAYYIRGQSGETGDIKNIKIVPYN